jgi:glycosyltransferase involved in cell wall biosynthesis
MFVYNPGDHDSRVLREADALRRAGHEVILVARHPDTQAEHVVRDRIGTLDVVRVPIPRGWRRIGYLARGPVRLLARAAEVWRTRPKAAGVLVVAAAAALPLEIALLPVTIFRRLRRSSPNRDLIEWLLRWRFVILDWNRAAADSAPVADVYHGHDPTALPAAVTAARRHRARYVYDSHEIFMAAGSGATRPPWVRRMFRRLERRWAKGAVAVVTVNDTVGAELRRRLRPARIVAVNNTPPRWTPPPGSDLIRQATGIPPRADIALSHGGFMKHRGLEELALALLEPRMGDVHAVLLGYGALEGPLRAMAREARFEGRLHVLPAVPSSELLPWIASADVGVMPIAPSSLNHLLTTPNKLFECLAAGVPVVASDLPGMRSVVLADPAAPLGELCDPTDPASIAAAIRRILDLAPDERAALRARCLRAAHERWNWETESTKLIGLYEDLASPATATPTGS